MAISRPMARLLLSERRVRPFHGSVLQLGRQTVLFAETQLSAWARDGRKVADDVSSNGASHLGSEARSGRGGAPMSDEEFFRFLGFDEVFSCDVSSYENATLILDLNGPVPNELNGKFDMIFDGGTMEHIFTVPQVLANIHSMLKRGGRVIHIAPTSNMVNHGFYSFSPTFFSDYYAANRYRLLTLYLFECFSWVGEWTAYDCLAGNINNRLGRLSTARMAGTFCVAEKIEDSCSGIVPAQGHFKKLWGGSSEESASNGPKQVWEMLKAKYPKLAEFILRLRAFSWRTIPGRGEALPPVVGKF